MKPEIKKLLILNLPYLLFVWLFDKVGAAVRLSPGADASAKLLHLGDGFTAAFSSIAPSFHPADLALGIAGAVIVRLIIYTKGKNAKKYRRGTEYGSARWGGADDIKPYTDPVFENNIPLTQTERLTMNSRPKLMAAKDKLIEQKQSGVVKAYQVDETKDKMVAGEAALALMWSGDAQYAIDLNDHLDYFVPSEGSNIWVDGAVILKSARNKENAEKFINFLCRPDIAQMNCEYIWYSSPNKGAIELMGEEYENNHVLNPSQEVQDRCEFFHDIDDTFRKIYENLWMEIKNTK